MVQIFLGSYNCYLTDNFSLEDYTSYQYLCFARTKKEALLKLRKKQIKEYGYLLKKEKRKWHGGIEGLIDKNVKMLNPLKIYDFCMEE